MSPFKAKIAERRVQVKELWSGKGKPTIREIARTLGLKPWHDTIVRHDLDVLGLKPHRRLKIRPRVEKLLLAGHHPHLVQRKVGCAMTYVHVVARDLRAEGKLAPAEDRSETALKRARQYLKLVGEVGTVREVAVKLGVKESHIYNTINGQGLSLVENRRAAA